MALDGRSDLGGLDIDAALVDHLGETYGDREGWKRLMNPTTIEERRHFRDFQEEIRGAKERLSRHQQSDFAIPLLDVEAHLTRTELEAIAGPHLEQTVQVTQAVIRAAGLDVAASAGVFLVGGASRMPLVATMLHRALGLAPTVLDQPEIVVAEGSVLWQAGADGATHPLQWTPPQPGQAGVFAPTPVAAPAAPHLTPQSARAQAPLTEPQTARPEAYRPSPPATLPAPTQQSPARQTLPPQTHQPVHTPPRPQTTASGDDADPPEPPLSDAERTRRKRIGTRAVVAIILVNVLVIAGLAWYFGPYGNGDDGGGEDLDVTPWFDSTWGPTAIGTLVGELPGAHEGAITSLAAVDTEAGSMLFSAGADGAVNRWSMDSGALIADYTIEGGVHSLWTTNLWGEPVVVAVGNDFRPYLWDTSADAFDDAGAPETAAPDLVRVGNVEGEPVLGLVTDSTFELYFTDQQVSTGVQQLPEGLSLPRFFTSEISGFTEVATINADARIEVIDGQDGASLGITEDTALLSEEATVEGMGLVYDDGTPYAMAYSSDQSLVFWDLDEMAPSGWYAAYGALDDEFHTELVATDEGTSLMYTDTAGDCYVYSLESGSEHVLEDDGTGIRSPRWKTWSSPTAASSRSPATRTATFNSGVWDCDHPDHRGGHRRRRGRVCHLGHGPGAPDRDHRAPGRARQRGVGGPHRLPRLRRMEPVHHRDLRAPRRGRAPRSGVHPAGRQDDRRPAPRPARLPGPPDPLAREARPRRPVRRRALPRARAAGRRHHGPHPRGALHRRPRAPHVLAPGRHRAGLRVDEQRPRRPLEKHRRLKADRAEDHQGLTAIGT